MSRSASRSDNPVVGPSNSSGVCDHGDVTFAIDPAPEYLKRCESTGVFWAPTEDVAGPIHLCPYHLARYLEAVDEAIEAKLVERGAREFAADPAFVTIDDAPDEVPLLGSRWQLHSIDQRGHAYYLSPDAIVELRPDFDPEDVIWIQAIPPGEFFEDVRQAHGFAAFAPGVALPTGGFA